MSQNAFENMLLASAEQADRALRPEGIALLRRSYDFFRKTGLCDASIQQVMALTSHEMRLIKQ